MSIQDHFESAILGTAIGDAIGLPREGLSRRRASRLFAGPLLSHRLVLGRGMISDDTEHTCMTGQALLVSGGNSDRFARSLGWRLRGWILALPAGVGKATARACFRLWLGFSPKNSGVWSAGNGPAMRASIIGIHHHDDLQALREFIHASSRLTHSDPAAEDGALAVALAAAYGVQCRIRADGTEIDPRAYLELLKTQLTDATLCNLIGQAVDAVITGASMEHYLQRAGFERGISGYVNHTVPATIFCWLRWPKDFRSAVEAVVLAGGDTDSTAAIVGALVGISAGIDSIPAEWSDRLIEWPRNRKWMKKLAAELAQCHESKGVARQSVQLFWPGILPRNLFFLCIVLLHGLRRLLPPW